MNTKLLMLALSLALLTPSAQAESERAHVMLTLAHQNGKLALPLREIATVFHVPASAERGASLRLTSAVLPDGKQLHQAEAEAAWQQLSRPEASSYFVWVSHLNGTLGIPKRSIQSLFLTETEGKTRLRIVYAADPSGKVLDGAEAMRVWEQLTQP